MGNEGKNNKKIFISSSVGVLSIAATLYLFYIFESALASAGDDAMGEGLALTMIIIVCVSIAFASCVTLLQELGLMERLDDTEQERKIK